MLLDNLLDSALSWFTQFLYIHPENRENYIICCNAIRKTFPKVSSNLISSQTTLSNLKQGKLPLSEYTTFFKEKSGGLKLGEEELIFFYFCGLDDSIKIFTDNNATTLEEIIRSAFKAEEKKRALNLVMLC